MTEAVQRALRAITDPAPEDARLAAAVPEGRTLHRLLGYSPGRGAFMAHPGNPLEHRVVIVDEASMIDMVLMEHLVRAVRPDARLVLLGDADQLPSVAAGAVLRDLVPRDGAAHAALDACAVRLTRSYRMDDRDPQGAAILTFARRVNADGGEVDTGDASEAWRAALTVRSDVPSLTFSGVEWLDGADRDTLDAFLARWHAERIEPLRPLTRERYRWSQATGAFADDERPALERLFAGLEASRLLCFTHGSRGGTRHVNAALHRLVLRARGLEGARGERAYDVVAGDPLIVLENDHDRGLWNGDQGVALWVTVDAAPRPRLMAVFRRGDGFAAFHLELLRDRVQRCHAMTVHKAQGSEFDHVAVLLPDHDGPLVTREVLYTAVTRARRSVTLVGRDDVLARAVARRTARFTGVRERLA
jgi:exodeoxyribonuclease V alpha subunit